MSSAAKDPRRDSAASSTPLTSPPNGPSGEREISPTRSDPELGAEGPVRITRAQDLQEYELDLHSVSRVAEGSFSASAVESSCRAELPGLGWLDHLRFPRVGPAQAAGMWSHSVVG